MGSAHSCGKLWCQHDIPLTHQRQEFTCVHLIRLNRLQATSLVYVQYHE